MAFKSSIFPPGYTSISGAPISPETLELLQEGDDSYIPAMDGREYNVSSRAGVRAYTEWVLAASRTLGQLTQRTNEVLASNVSFKVKAPVVLQMLSFETLFWGMLRVMGEMYVHKRYTVDEFGLEGIPALMVFIETQDADPTTPEYDEGFSAREINLPEQWVSYATLRHGMAVRAIESLESTLAEIGLPLQSTQRLSVGPQQSVEDLLGPKKDVPKMKGLPVGVTVVLVAIAATATATIVMSIALRPLLLSLAEWMQTVNAMNRLNLEVAETTEQMCIDKYEGNPEGYAQCANQAVERMIDNSERLNDIGINALAHNLLGAASAVGTAVLFGGAALGAFFLLRD